MAFKALVAASTKTRFPATWLVAVAKLSAPGVEVDWPSACTLSASISTSSCEIMRDVVCSHARITSEPRHSMGMIEYARRINLPRQQSCDCRTTTGTHR